MSKLSRDTNDPIRLALRSDLKRHFLVDLDTTESPFATQWPDGHLVVYGSTLMRKLMEDQNVKLPYWGRKASDIDIAVHTKNYVPTEEYLRKYDAIIPPLMHTTLMKDDFDVEFPKPDGGFETIIHEELADYLAQPEKMKKLGEEFVISKRYAKHDVLTVLRKAHKAELIEQVAASDQEFYYADNIISVQNTPPHMLLDPVDFLPNRFLPEGRIDLKRDNRLNLLTAKIVRGFDSRSFKPTDFIDIYNLMNAEPALFDMSPDGDNYATHIRCLIVANMASHNVHRLDGNWMKNFTPSDAQVDAFVANCARVVSKDQVIDRDTARMMIQHARDLVFHAFGYNENNADTRLEELLSINEKNFITKPYGYSVLPGGYTKSLDGQFEMDPDLLKADHPTTFERYPSLAHNLKNHFQIVEQIEARREQYSSRQY